MTSCRRNIKIVRFKNMLNKDTRAFSKFDFNSTIRKKHWAVQLFESKVKERFSLTSRIEHPT